MQPRVSLRRAQRVALAGSKNGWVPPREPLQRPEPGPLLRPLLRPLILSLFERRAQFSVDVVREFPRMLKLSNSPTREPAMGRAPSPPIYRLVYRPYTSTGYLGSCILGSGGWGTIRVRPPLTLDRTQGRCDTLLWDGLVRSLGQSVRQNGMMSLNGWIFSYACMLLPARCVRAAQRRSERPTAP